MTLTIKKCSLSEIESTPNFDALLDAYAQELVVEGAPPFRAKLEMYRQLESLGAMEIFGAFWDDMLVGLVTVLVNVFPHCSVVMAVTESLFVFREHRKTGAGTKLIRTAEKNAHDRGSGWLFISAPFGGDLAEILSHSDNYQETNRIFFRNLSNV